jgi:sugar lactone lactonase YvrE
MGDHGLASTHRRKILNFFFLSLITTSCAKTGLDVGCTEGLVRACLCASNVVGVQRCQADRSYGPCQCDLDGGLDATADVSRDVAIDGPDDRCTGIALAAGCRVGRCTVTAPLDALGDRPVVSLRETPLPDALREDAVGPVLCEVRAIEGSWSSRLLLQLTITTDDPAPEDSVLFEYTPPSARSVGASTRAPMAVTGFITAEGLYGITRRAGPFQLDQTLGVDRLSADTPAGLLRNISASGISAAWWDGARLYIGSGRRVLIYRTLRPAIGQRPDVVLGQPDLSTTRQEVTSSIITNVSSIWSDGNQLIVGDASRVLIWKNVPTRDFAPADIVIGQRDFSTNTPNQGGAVSASSLSNAGQVTSDGRRLAVTDPGNHRVLIWDEIPTVIGQPATRVIGQTSFTANLNDESGATPLYLPSGVLLDGARAWVTSFGLRGALQRVSLDETLVNPRADLAPLRTALQVQSTAFFRAGQLAALSDGGLAVRVAWGAHVAVFRSAPTSPGGSFDFVLGFPDRDRMLASLVSASTMTETTPLAGNRGVLLVPDNARLLLWQSTPSYSFEPASFVWGQAGPSTNLRNIDYRGISSSTLGQPADVAIHGDTVAVADRGNNRVLLFDRLAILRGDRAARVVLGQPDARSFAANRDRPTPAADTLSAPSGVALDGTRLYVADSGNHRILIWNSIPNRDGQPADLVLGQRTFSDQRPNHGNGDSAPRDGYCDVDAEGLFDPVGIASDGMRLYVADRANNRVLVWSPIPSRNGTPATAALGQDTLTEGRPNRGRGTFSPIEDGFNYPMGVTVDGDALWVADTENNRIVRIDDVATAPRASLWIGQPDGRTVTNHNVAVGGSGGAGTFYGYTPTEAGTITPRAVVRVDDTLLVSEPFVHRVHLFSARTGQSLAIVGQATATGQTSNAGGIGPSSLAQPLGLATDGARAWIADAQNNRVVVHPLPLSPWLTSRATLALGQEGLVRNGFNQSSAARGAIVRGPRGLARDEREVFVADTEHHRVLRFDAPWTEASVPTAVYGQPDDGLTLPNQGDAPNATTLHGPRGVFVTRDALFIADTQNHRVLIFDRSSTRARRVLGQADASGSLANRGGNAGLETMHSPEAVYFDGTRLYVADTGNHRVLVWNELPTRDGQPADALLGQSAPTAVEGNRGSSTPSARSMLFPSALLGIGDALFVADTGNNRVLRFDRAPRPGEDLEASLVLGQPSPTERQSAARVEELTRMAGPAALAEDGVKLFVLDRDLSRVLRFSLRSLSANAESALRLSDLGVPLARRPSGLIVERGPFFTTRLLITDTGNDRVLRASPSTRLE